MVWQALVDRGFSTVSPAGSRSWVESQAEEGVLRFCTSIDCVCWRRNMFTYTLPTVVVGSDRDYINMGGNWQWLNWGENEKRLTIDWKKKSRKDWITISFTWSVRHLDCFKSYISCWPLYNQQLYFSSLSLTEIRSVKELPPGKMSHVQSSPLWKPVFKHGLHESKDVGTLANQVWPVVFIVVVDYM